MKEQLLPTTNLLRFLLPVVFILVAGLAPMTVSFAADATAGRFEGIQNKNPGADFWRMVRQRQEPQQSRTQIDGVDSAMLINPRGEWWKTVRMEKLAVYGIYALAGMLLLLLLFYLGRGKVQVQGGLSGRMVHRFSDYERVLHWTLAVIFLFLAATGLMLLFGRTLLIPLLGHELFALLASSSKEGHNLFGPLFLVSLLLMLVQFARRNIYEKGDLTWLLRGGGLIGKEHASGGFFNMGEKTWYWLVILGGLLISVTGLILVLPYLGQGRVVMEWAHILHVTAAILLISVSLGHMYLGSIGSEATGEGMKTGYVDIRWAAEHHDRWAKLCEDEGRILSAEEYARVTGDAKSLVREVGGG